MSFSFLFDFRYALYAMGKFVIVAVLWFLSIIVILITDAAMDIFSDLAGVFDITTVHAKQKQKIKDITRKMSRQKKKVTKTVHRMTGRAEKMILRNVKDAAVSAIPFVTAAGITYAIIDLHDICENVRDLNELQELYREQPDRPLVDACNKADEAVEDIHDWVHGVLDWFFR